MTGETSLPIIGIVDDDEAIRESISGLLRSAGYASSVFESAGALLNSDRLPEIRCLILDIQMPGLSGLELQQRLAQMNHSAPIIFLSGHTADEARSGALKQGAVAFLAKPVDEGDLLAAVQSALEPPKR